MLLLRISQIIYILSGLSLFYALWFNYLFIQLFSSLNMKFEYQFTAVEFNFFILLLIWL